MIRANLIRNLNDSAARGNRQAINLLVNQLQRRPPLTGGAPDYAGYALKRIATKKDFARIAELLEQLPPEVCVSTNARNAPWSPTPGSLVSSPGGAGPWRSSTTDTPQLSG